MKSVLLVGYLGFKNFGDDLLCEQMIHFLKSQSQMKDIYVWGDEALPRKDILQLIKVLIKVEGVLFIGGGLWQNKSGKGLSIWFYLLLAKFFLFIGKKIILFNQGVDLVTHPWIKSSLKSLFTQSRLSILRETSHYSAFNYLPFAQMPDSAFLIATKPQIQKGVLGLSLNGLGSTAHELAWENLLMAVKLLPGLKKIYVFNFFPAQDGFLSQEIFKVLSPSHAVEVIEGSKILEKIVECEKVIASRYHALVLALSSGSTTLGISHSTKIVRLCQIYNQTHLNLELKPKELAVLIKEAQPADPALIKESKNKVAQAFAMLSTSLK